MQRRYACAVDTDVFRERVSGTKVSSMLDAHKKWLKKIFTAYAAAASGISTIIRRSHHKIC
mgnify:CR=1 FL=1